MNNVQSANNKSPKQRVGYASSIASPPGNPRESVALGICHPQ
jgi:hypothetical protein